MAGLLLDADASLSVGQAREILSVLRTAFAEEGLYIVLPVGAAEWQQLQIGTAVGQNRRRAGDLILVGDGGPSFFAKFQSARRTRSGNPLDDFTRVRVEAVVDGVFTRAGIAVAISYPFGAPDGSPVPFQRLGQAAGLPAPGPLGLQVHPVFGPWWAYRALIATPLVFDREPVLPSSCAPCVRPCVQDCPSHPVGLAVAADEAPLRCGDACGARARCPVGAQHKYPEAQIAFHARARAALLAALAR